MSGAVSGPDSGYGHEDNASARMNRPAEHGAAVGTAEPIGSAEAREMPQPEVSGVRVRCAGQRGGDRADSGQVSGGAQGERGDPAAVSWCSTRWGGRPGSAWVPRVAMDVIAERLAMPPIRVYEVATFYLMFNTKPIGRYHLQVCKTTPCWLRGSDDVTRACRDETGIKGWRDTSTDGLFTMSEVECLGACVNAPVLQVDDDYYEDLDYDRTRALLQALRRGERPRAGSVIGRATSAPEGGPTTLLVCGVAGCLRTRTGSSPTCTGCTTPG